MRVLIGYDGSESSKSAIEDLKVAGLPHDSEIQVISVADLLMTSPSPSDIADAALTSRRAAELLQHAQNHATTLIREAYEYTKEASRRLSELFPHSRISINVLTGTPTSELIDAANRWNADLVVVGSEGRSAFKRLFLGSVSKRVVTDSAASVRVARPRGRIDVDAPPRIIIGVDGSPAAEQAIYAVGQRVWPTGTETLLVAVDDSTPTTQIVSRLPQATAMINEYFQNRASRVSAMLEWGTKEFNNIGLTTSVVTEKGDATKVLLAKAEESNADSIFVGTRDFKSAFERFRLGSVSTAIVTKAHCSVEVVRPSDEKQE